MKKLIITAVVITTLVGCLAGECDETKPQTDKVKIVLESGKTDTLDITYTGKLQLQLNNLVDACGTVYVYKVSYFAVLDKP